MSFADRAPYQSLTPLSCNDRHNHIVDMPVTASANATADTFSAVATLSIQVFCTNCGIGNKRVNEFCFKCGTTLIVVETDGTVLSSKYHFNVTTTALPILPPATPPRSSSGHALVNKSEENEGEDGDVVMSTNDVDGASQQPSRFTKLKCQPDLLGSKRSPDVKPLITTQPAPFPSPLPLPSLSSDGYFTPGAPPRTPATLATYNRLGVDIHIATPTFRPISYEDSAQWYSSLSSSQPCKTNSSRLFFRNENYIREVQKSFEECVFDVDYDIDSEDEEWLVDYVHTKGPLSEIDLEIIMNCFEKESIIMSRKAGVSISNDVVTNVGAAVGRPVPVISPVDDANKTASGTVASQNQQSNPVVDESQNVSHHILVPFENVVGVLQDRWRVAIAKQQTLLPMEEVPYFLTEDVFRSIYEHWCKRRMSNESKPLLRWEPDAFEPLMYDNSKNNSKSRKREYDESRKKYILDRIKTPSVPGSVHVNRKRELDMKHDGKHSSEDAGQRNDRNLPWPRQIWDSSSAAFVSCKFGYATGQLGLNPDRVHSDLFMFQNGILASLQSWSTNSQTANANQNNGISYNVKYLFRDDDDTSMLDCESEPVKDLPLSMTDAVSAVPDNGVTAPMESAASRSDVAAFRSKLEVEQQLRLLAERDLDRLRRAFAEELVGMEDALVQEYERKLLSSKVLVDTLEKRLELSRSSLSVSQKREKSLQFHIQKLQQVSKDNETLQAECHKLSSELIRYQNEATERIANLTSRIDSMQLDLATEREARMWTEVAAEDIKRQRDIITTRAQLCVRDAQVQLKILKEELRNSLLREIELRNPDRSS